MHFAGTMTLLALSFLTPYFYYIPRATLAAVLICAVVFMIDLKIIKLLWRGCSQYILCIWFVRSAWNKAPYFVSKVHFFFVERDAIAAIGTFFICVFISVEIGLLLGVVFCMIFFIRPSARPTLQIVNCKVKHYKRLEKWFHRLQL